MMDMPELIDDPRFNTMTAWLEEGRGDEFLAIFLPWSIEHTKKECVERGQTAGANCAPLNNMAEVLDDPHFQARGFWTDIEHPVTGRITYPGKPIMAEEMPWIIRRPAPLLGQHNEEIYCDKLGYKKTELVKLKEAGCI